MISIASSIKFREVIDGALPSFDNTFHEDETFKGSAKIPYCQKFLATDTEVKIQVKVLTGQLVEFSYSLGEGGAWQSMTGETIVSSGPVYDYYEMTIDFSAYSENVRFAAAIIEDEAIVGLWYSEPCEVIEDYAGLLQIEAFNLENAFEVDYSTEITHLWRVEGELKEYRPGGETSVFDNQEEVTKIKGEVKRILAFKTEPIPRYLAEMLTVACQLDKLFINDVEFVAENSSEVDNDRSTLVVFSVNLTQRNVIGLNTHDIGFDCDAITTSDTMVLQEENASGQKSFTVPEGYLIATITGYRTAGTAVMTAGTTPGGSEIVSAKTLTAAAPLKVVTVNGEIATTGDSTLYVSVSGTGATAHIYVLLFKNRQ